MKSSKPRIGGIQQMGSNGSVLRKAVLLPFKKIQLEYAKWETRTNMKHLEAVKQQVQISRELREQRLNDLVKVISQVGLSEHKNQSQVDEAIKEYKRLADEKSAEEQQLLEQLIRKRKNNTPFSN